MYEEMQSNLKHSIIDINLFAYIAKNVNWKRFIDDVETTKANLHKSLGVWKLSPEPHTQLSAIRKTIRSPFLLREHRAAYTRTWYNLRVYIRTYASIAVRKSVENRFQKT